MVAAALDDQPVIYELEQRESRMMGSARCDRVANGVVDRALSLQKESSARGVVDPVIEPELAVAREM